MFKSKNNMSNLELNTTKAGMQGIDTDHINNIIRKASEGSKFYKHKQKCQERLDAKIIELQKQRSMITDDQLHFAEQEMSNLRRMMEQDQDLSRCIVHVDMDMFFAAVEMRDDPTLRSKPMAVGSMGMLSTSNYEARKFGVRAAMPGFIGKKLCPDLIIVSPSYVKYKSTSKDMQEIFSTYDPNFCPMSLDEAYLDITNYIDQNLEDYEDEDSNMSHAELVVQELRGKIEAKTQLTASAGISFNTLLAKVCSDLNKPNGQYYLPFNKENVNDFVKTLSIRKVGGIGSVTEQQLKSLDISTCGDLWDKRGLLRLLFTETSYKYFLRVSLGIGSSVIEAHTERDRKSVSNETTFSATSDKSVLMKTCNDLCEEICNDLMKKDIFAKVCTLKIKTSNFEVRTRAQTLIEATNDFEIIRATSMKLLNNEIYSSSEPLSLRLIGVRMSNLIGREERSSKRQITISDLFKKKSLGDKSSLKESGKPDIDVVSISNAKSKGVEELNDDFTKAIYESDDEECFECPLCFKSYDSYEELNTHVNNCLLETNEDGYDEKMVNNPDLVLGCSSKVDNSNEPNSILSEKFNLVEDFNISKMNTMDKYRDNLLKSKENEACKANCNEKFTCPICNSQAFDDISILNNHIDICLNKGMVQKLVKESNNSLNASISHKCSDGNHSKKRKLSNISGPKPSKMGSSSLLHKFLGIDN